MREGICIRNSWQQPPKTEPSPNPRSIRPEASPKRTGARRNGWAISFFAQANRVRCLSSQHLDHAAVPVSDECAQGRHCHPTVSETLRQLGALGAAESKEAAGRQEHLPRAGRATLPECHRPVRPSSATSVRSARMRTPAVPYRRCAGKRWSTIRDQPGRSRIDSHDEPVCSNTGVSFIRN